MANDLEIGDLNCYRANNFKTQIIDKLASGGTRYSYACTAPLCEPARALSLTGPYAFRTGATNQDSTGLMKAGVETMMPKILKQLGYVTAMIGKWGQLPCA